MEWCFVSISVLVKFQSAELEEKRLSFPGRYAIIPGYPNFSLALSVVYFWFGFETIHQSMSSTISSATFSDGTGGSFATVVNTVF